jgi:hypothetical protein
VDPEMVIIELIMDFFAGNAGPFVEDASYLRLREIGLYYSIPQENLENGLMGMCLT